MKKLWMSGAAAVMAISIAGVNAQQPPTQPPATQPTTQPPTTQPQTHTPDTAKSGQMQSVTLTGCVYKEEAIPGRKPNVAERAGVLEDYIFVASSDTSAGTAGTTGTTPPATTPPATMGGTAGAKGAAMWANKAFKLEKIEDDRLKVLVGKRVEVTGRVDAEHGDMGRTGTTGTTGAPARDKNLGPDEIELAELEVTSIKEVPGTCPTTPTIRK